MILAVAATTAGFTRCSMCTYAVVCAAREDYSEEDTEVIPFYPTDPFRDAWQRSRPFSDERISPIGWANAVTSASLCARCAMSADVAAVGVLTSAGEASLGEGLAAWHKTQRIAREQHAAHSARELYCHHQMVAGASSVPQGGSPAVWQQPRVMATGTGRPTVSPPVPLLSPWGRNA